jgi:hypothetical protein
MDLVLRSRMVELYLHSPIRFYGAVFNEAQRQLYFVFVLSYLDGKVWTGFNWLRNVTSGGLF